MKKKHCFMLLAVLVIAVIAASTRLLATENAPDDLLDPEMEEVLFIVADGILNSLSDNSAFGDSDGCDIYRTEALVCLEILAETVDSGDIFTEGLTLDGLNYLYQEIRAQKKLYPELKAAFDKFRVHVNNHRSELEKPETVPQRAGGDAMGDPCYTRDRR